MDHLPEIESFSVSAGVTFNHPTERYANFRFDIQLHVQSPAGATEQMLDRFSILATQRVQAHKEAILADCETLDAIRGVESRLQRPVRWKQDIAKKQERLQLAELYREYLGKWVSLSREERVLIHQFFYDFGEYIVIDSDTFPEEEMLPRLARHEEKLKAEIETLSTEGPAAVKALREELAGLKLKILLAPGVLEAHKEIAPGHPDHPETTEREDYN